MNATDQTTDRFEKTINLSAGRSRVWRALTTATEFSAWFGVTLKSDFAPGAKVVGVIRADNSEFDGLVFEMTVDRMEPERFFSFSWHPFAIERGVDYSAEPPTIVAFVLDEVGGGTRLTVSETGFDGIPESRRALAFRMNSEGWAEQLENIKAHVESHA